jgi:hypothetical protein
VIGSYNFLEGVNYMLQILMACNLFVLLLKKREHAKLRFAVGMAACLLFAGLFGEFVPMPDFPIGTFLYLGSFMLVSIPYMWFVCEISSVEAVYCSILSFAIQHFASESCLLFRLVLGPNKYIIGIFFVVYIVTYYTFYRICVKKMVAGKHVDVKFKKSLISIITILLVSLVLSVTGRQFFQEDATVMAIINRVYDMLCCFFILWSQTMQKEALHAQRNLDYMEHLWNTQKDVYRLTQANIDLINQKCHDLKHQIAALREIDEDFKREAYLKDIEQSIIIYDSSLKTGNKALDTVLTEKSLYCNAHGIALTCVADASGLSFMDIVDLYTVFGNALDNAIESTDKLSDPEKKVIIVKIFTQGELLLIQIENYYEDEIRFKDEMPLTTKKNKGDHGYGMKSIRYTIEKYDGSMTMHTEDHLFRLQILIPLPERGGNIK